MNKAFSIICAITGLLWLLFVFCIPPFAFTGYGADLFFAYANTENGLTLWNILLNPFVPVLLSGFVTFLYTVFAFAGKPCPLAPLVTNSFMLFLFLMYTNTSVVGATKNLQEYFPSTLSMSFYIVILGIMVGLFAILQILNVITVEALESVDEHVDYDTAEPQKLLNRAMTKPVQIPEEQAPKGLNPEIPKLAEGTARKQRIATKLAFTETLQKSAEDDILL